MNSINPESCLDQATQNYRMNALKSISQENVSTESWGELNYFIPKNVKTILSMCYPGNLARDYATPVLQLLIDKIRMLKEKDFPEYSPSIDGTPGFAEAECVIMMFVTKQYQIVEMFTMVGLFKRKLNLENLTSHLLQTINERLTLPLCDWMAVQLDRSSTNKAAISKIKSEFLDTNPTQNFCASHGINNASKRLLDCADRSSR